VRDAESGLAWSCCIVTMRKAPAQLYLTLTMMLLASAYAARECEPSYTRILRAQQAIVREEVQASPCQ